MNDEVGNDSETRGRRDPIRELQDRIEAALDEVRPKIKRALEELDAKVDAAVEEMKPRAQQAKEKVQPKVDQFMSDMQPRLDTLLERLQAKIDDLRRDLDTRANRDREYTGPAGQIGPPDEPPPGDGGPGL